MIIKREGKFFKRYIEKGNCKGCAFFKNDLYRICNDVICYDENNYYIYKEVEMMTIYDYNIDKVINQTKLKKNEFFIDIHTIGTDLKCRICEKPFAESLYNFGYRKGNCYDKIVKCTCKKSEVGIFKIKTKKYTLVSLERMYTSSFINYERIKTNDISKAMKNYQDVSLICFKGWPKQKGEKGKPKCDAEYIF